VAEGGYQTAWVDVEKEFWFSVDVYFDVFVGEFLVLERDPDAVDERALVVSFGRYI